LDLTALFGMGRGVPQRYNHLKILRLSLITMTKIGSKIS
jgi:hypothetical protein